MNSMWIKSFNFSIIFLLTSILTKDVADKKLRWYVIGPACGRMYSGEKKLDIYGHIKS